MGQEITQRELRNNSGEIMRGLDDGESYVVTRNGTAVAELIPLRRNVFVAASRVLASFENAPSIDGKQFRDDINAAIDNEVEPRA